MKEVDLRWLNSANIYWSGWQKQEFQFVAQFFAFPFEANIIKCQIIHFCHFYSHFSTFK